MSETQGACLPAGWRLCPLGDIATRVIRRNHIDSDNILTISARHGLVNQEEYFQRKVASSDRLGYWLLHRGDFAYNKSYSDGYPAGVVRRLENYDFGVVSPLYICFRPDERHVDPSFLAHYFDSGLLDDDLLWVAKEGVRNHGLLNVRVDDFFNLPLLLPTLEEQRRIAEILDALDARIRCQDQLIAKLVAVQQGLESSLLDMPDIPSESLANYLASSPKNGYSPKEVDEWTGMVALGLGCLTANGFQPRQLKNVPSGDSRNVGAVLRDGDLLMSRANTRELVGLVGIYKDVGHDCIYPDLMMRLTPTKRCRVGYLELVLRSSAVRRQIQGMAQGTSESMVKISSSIVQDLKVQIPDLAVQDRILEVVDAARARRDAEEAVRDGLLRLKAGLAEDLLTGRVRVPEAEAVVESL